VQSTTVGEPSITWIESDEQLQEALALRVDVFCGEQGVAPEDELDGLDDSARHVGALVDGQVIGTLRLLAQGGRAKIGRVAVRADYRRRGIAQAMMELALAGARSEGCSRAVLTSQTYAIALYEKSGFAVDSEEFEEAGIPHVWMVREL